MVSVRQISLHQSIFRLVIGLVLVTSMTILANLWWTTYQQAQSKMSKDINLAENVLSELLSNRETLLFTSASVLTEDFGFKQAIATKDQATILSAINNHGDRINADLMSIFDLQGETIATSVNLINGGAIVPVSAIEEAKSSGGYSGFLLVNGRLFQTMMLRIDAPTPIAISLVGFEIAPSFVSNLESTTQLSVNILAEPNSSSTARIDTNNSPLLINNTLSSSSPIVFNKETIKVDELKWYQLIFDSKAVVTERFELFMDNEISIDVELTQSLRALTSEFSALKTNISLITLVAVSIAFIVAMLYSRKLSTPISYLANVARTISSGDYQQAIDTRSSSKEFHHLASALGNMQSSIQEREEQIIFQAQHDPLTRLYTRHHASEILDKRIQQGESFQAFGINILGFRDVNDVFGYQFSDYCLSVLANRLASAGGLAARFGGGEFLWVTKDALSHIEIESLQHQLEQIVSDDTISCKLKVTIGIVNCPSQADTAETLYKHLNIVIDEAQSNKVPWLLFDKAFEEKYSRRLAIVSQLRENLGRNGKNFTLSYQPKLNLKNGETKAVEALIRWIDPVLGFVPPDEFIQIAEHAGLIGQVTKWVVKRAIADAKTLKESGHEVCVAINLSARDLTNETLLDEIQSELSKVGLSNSMLSFEITESDLVKDTDKAVEHLQAFKQAGFELAIDDFGTGYSSMAYLKSFPVNYLKIDKSFVLDLASNNNDKDIVETILQLAQKFDLQVIAEGVEDKQSLSFLRQAGCEYAQGYYMSRPIPLNDLTQWLAQQMPSQNGNEIEYTHD